MPKRQNTPHRIHVRASTTATRQLRELCALRKLNEGWVIEELIRAAWDQALEEQSRADPAAPRHVVRPREHWSAMYTEDEMALALGIDVEELRRQIDPSQHGTPSSRRAAGLVYYIAGSAGYLFKQSDYERNVQVWGCVHVAGGHHYNYSEQPLRCSNCDHVVLGGELG